MSEPAPKLTEAKADRSAFWKNLADLVKTALVVIVLVVITRGFILQPFIVEGSSMAPRFHTNDYLLVDKLSYHFHPVSRGDIVVFKYPYNTSVNYVKRVIGLPGETVKIQDGSVYIINAQNPNGFKLNEPYVIDDAQTLLPSGASTGEYTVPSDSYFVMGDNRPASSDSREWSFLPKSDMIGRVIIQAFPLSEASILHDPTY
jgi:signal peptidase I